MSSLVGTLTGTVAPNSNYTVPATGSFVSVPLTISFAGNTTTPFSPTLTTGGIASFLAMNFGYSYVIDASVAYTRTSGSLTSGVNAYLNAQNVGTSGPPLTVSMVQFAPLNLQGGVFSLQVSGQAGDIINISSGTVTIRAYTTSSPEGNLILFNELRAALEALLDGLNRCARKRLLKLISRSLSC